MHSISLANLKRILDENYKLFKILNNNCQSTIKNNKDNNIDKIVKHKTISDLFSKKPIVLLTRLDQDYLEDMLTRQKLRNILENASSSTIRETIKILECPKEFNERRLKNSSAIINKKNEYSSNVQTHAKLNLTIQNKKSSKTHKYLKKKNKKKKPKKDNTVENSLNDLENIFENQIVIGEDDEVLLQQQQQQQQQQHHQHHQQLSEVSSSLKNSVTVVDQQHRISIDFNREDILDNISQISNNESDHVTSSNLSPNSTTLIPSNSNNSNTTLTKTNSDLSRSSQIQLESSSSSSLASPLIVETLPNDNCKSEINIEIKFPPSIHSRIGNGKYRIFFDLSQIDFKKSSNTPETESIASNTSTSLLTSSSSTPQSSSIQTETITNKKSNRQRKRKKSSIEDNKINTTPISKNKKRKNNKNKSDIVKFIEEFSVDDHNNIINTSNLNITDDNNVSESFLEVLRATESITSTTKQIQENDEESSSTTTTTYLTNFEKNQWIRTTTNDNNIIDVQQSNGHEEEEEEEENENNPSSNIIQNQVDDNFIIPTDIEANAMRLVHYIENDSQQDQVIESINLQQQQQSPSCDIVLTSTNNGIITETVDYDLSSTNITTSSTILPISTIITTTITNNNNYEIINLCDGVLDLSKKSEKILEKFIENSNNQIQNDNQKLNEISSLKNYDCTNRITIDDYRKRKQLQNEINISDNNISIKNKDMPILDDKIPINEKEENHVNLNKFFEIENIEIQSTSNEILNLNEKSTNFDEIDDEPVITNEKHKCDGETECNDEKSERNDEEDDDHDVLSLFDFSPLSLFDDVESEDLMKPDDDKKSPSPQFDDEPPHILSPPPPLPSSTPSHPLITNTSTPSPPSPPTLLPTTITSPTTTVVPSSSSAITFTTSSTAVVSSFTPIITFNNPKENDLDKNSNNNKNNDNICNSLIISEKIKNIENIVNEQQTKINLNSIDVLKTFRNFKIPKINHTNSIPSLSTNVVVHDEICSSSMNSSLNLLNQDEQLQQQQHQSQQHQEQSYNQTVLSLSSSNHDLQQNQSKFQQSRQLSSNDIEPLIKRNIHSIFGSICYRYLNDTCDLYKCKYNHNFIDKITIKKRLLHLNINTIDAAYKFMWRNYKLFELYFPIFCEIYGEYKNAQKLIQMIYDCSMYNNGYIYFKYIIDGLLKTQLYTKIMAIKEIIKRCINKTQIIIDIFIDMIINTDPLQFIDILYEFNDNYNYKFSINSINKFAEICNKTYNIQLINLTLKIITRTSCDYIAIGNNDHIKEFIISFQNNGLININQNELLNEIILNNSITRK